MKEITNYLYYDYEKWRITNLTRFHLQALMFGIMEGMIVPEEGTGDKWILGAFSTYHLILFIFIWSLSIGWKTGWLYIPRVLVLEDLTYYVSQWSWPQEGNWVSSLLGGFYVGEIFIPWVYLLGVGLTWAALVIYRELWEHNHKRFD